MNQAQSLIYFATPYDCDAYGMGTYNDAASDCISSVGGPNTGYAPAQIGGVPTIPLVIGVIILAIVVSLLIRSFLRRHRPRK